MFFFINSQTAEKKLKAAAGNKSVLRLKHYDNL